MLELLSRKGARCERLPQRCVRVALFGVQDPLESQCLSAVTVLVSLWVHNGRREGKQLPELLRFRSEDGLCDGVVRVAQTPDCRDQLAGAGIA